MPDIIHKTNINIYALIKVDTGGCSDGNIDIIVIHYYECLNTIAV